MGQDLSLRPWLLPLWVKSEVAYVISRGYNEEDMIQANLKNHLPWTPENVCVIALLNINPSAKSNGTY